MTTLIRNHPSLRLPAAFCVHHNPCFPHLISCTLVPGHCLEWQAKPKLYLNVGYSEDAIVHLDSGV